MKIGPKCDIFSTGVLFHTLLTGKPLFKGETGTEVYKNNKNCHINLENLYERGIDEKAIDLLKKMLVINPE